MPLPRTLCRFLLQAAAHRSLPRSGLVQGPLCRAPDYAASMHFSPSNGALQGRHIGIIRAARRWQTASKLAGIGPLLVGPCSSKLS
jgi:hypothetical protein